jgi:riboflavin biosynthesis pyrimidine reductase
MMAPFVPDEVRSGDDVSRALARCFGHDPARDQGILHSAAVWEGPHGTRALRIGEHAPHSAIDFFLLHAARARASAIVTTGRILREEPRLRYDLAAASAFSDALIDYRARHVGLAGRATVVVLSRGGDLTFTHPAFHGWALPVLFVPTSAPKSLDDVAGFHGIRVRRFASLDLDVALAALRDEGSQTTLVEAGVSTTKSRYEAGRGIDELVLSRFLEPAIDSRAIGGEFPDRASLEHIFGAPASECAFTEPSGNWSVTRYRAS